MVFWDPIERAPDFPNDLTMRELTQDTQDSETELSIRSFIMEDKWSCAKNGVAFGSEKQGCKFGTDHIYHWS